MAEPILQVQHLSKSFGANAVLKDIDFSVSKNDVTCIIGASGSGKSTLLRCINLLETPTSGDIFFHGKKINGRGVNAAEYRTHVGMVFQSFNLFANMTVLENCMVGQTKVLGVKKDEAEANAISWVTTIMVVPSCARFRMTDSTSPTISGSSAEVGSSKSSSSGFMASARAMATRCF